MEIDSALWTGRQSTIDRVLIQEPCPICSGSGLGPVRKIVEDRGDRLYTVYEACGACDGTGERGDA